MSEHKVVAVSWNDAHYNTDEAEASEITHRPWVYITTGVLVRSDEIGVTLACDVGEDGRFRGRNFVPRGMVIEEWEVGPLAKKLKRLRRGKPKLGEAMETASPSSQ